MSADAVMRVSVLVERRVASNPWHDYIWRPIGVLPRPGGEPGQVLASDDTATQYEGGTLDLELFRGETEGYLTNLSQVPPVIYVVLRRSEEAGALDVTPFLVTACPYEAMGYDDGNDDIVEPVPMPAEIVTWVREFVTLHHVDTPFVKRKNRRHRDDYGGKTASPGQRGLS